MTMSTRVENFDRMTISAKRTGVVMFKINVRYGLVLGLLVSSVAWMAPRSASGQALPPVALRNDNTGTLGERPERDQYDNRAFPASEIGPAQQKASYNAHLAISQLQSATGASWKGIGPTIPFVVATSTYTGRPTYVSGRVTALALSPRCRGQNCRLFVGAAGGGVWMTKNALASQLNGHPSSNGIPSNSIGSIIFDPTDATGKTLYVGTGEANGSSDSEAGIGLYKSTDQGHSWSLVPGSLPVAEGRVIAGIAIDTVG